MSEMRTRKVKRFGGQYEDHKHDRFPWHWPHIKHREMNLTPIYPVEGEGWREKNLRRLEDKQKLFGVLFGGYVGAETNALLDELREKTNIPARGFCPPTSPIEIYIETLLPDVYSEAAKLLSGDIGDALFRMTMGEYFEILLMSVFLYFHGVIYMHEMIHRLTIWNRSYEQNRKANKMPHEDWIQPLAKSIAGHIYLKDVEAEVVK